MRVIEHWSTILISVQKRFLWVIIGKVEKKFNSTVTPYYNNGYQISITIAKEEEQRLFRFLRQFTRNNPRGRRRKRKK